MTENQWQNTKTAIAVLITLLTWSSAFVGIRAGLAAYGPGSMALFRYVIASLVMLPIWLRHRNYSPPTVAELLTICVLGFFGFGVYNVALNYGEITVAAATASFVVSLIPVFAIILAVLFLKERLNRWQWLGVVVSFIGVCIIAVGESEHAHFDYGVIFSLIAAISGAIYSVFQKPLLKKFHPIEITTYAIWFGTLCLMIYAPSLFHDIQLAKLHYTLWVIYLGIAPSAIGFLCWSYVLSKMPASKASAYLYMLPLFTTIMGLLLLGEMPVLMAFAGGFIALVGAIFVVRARSRGGR